MNQLTEEAVEAAAKAAHDAYEFNAATLGYRELMIRANRAALTAAEPLMRSAWEPCDPCKDDRHDACTGDCPSMCCALASSEAEGTELRAENERLGDVIARCDRERDELHGEIIELQAEIHRHHRDFAAWEEMAAKGAELVAENKRLRALVHLAANMDIFDPVDTGGVKRTLLAALDAGRDEK